jgi:hypothetical protein
MMLVVGMDGCERLLLLLLMVVVVVVVMVGRWKGCCSWC